MPVVDKTKEMNERLLVEVRKRLQAAKSQLNTQAPSEGDVGTPVDSPLGGRPTVLHGRDTSGLFLTLLLLLLCCFVHKQQPCSQLC